MHTVVPANSKYWQHAPVGSNKLGVMLGIDDGIDEGDELTWQQIGTHA